MMRRTEEQSASSGSHIQKPPALPVEHHFHRKVFGRDIAYLFFGGGASIAGAGKMAIPNDPHQSFSDITALRP